MRKCIASMNFRPTNLAVFISALLLITGILIIFTPWYIFPVCDAKDPAGASLEDMNQRVTTKMVCSLSSGFMNCWYTARVESLFGVLIILSGIVLLTTKRNSILSGKGVMIMGLGVSVVLIPTTIIGMCDMTGTICNFGTKPALILLGSIVTLLGFSLVIRYHDQYPEFSK
ncbi:MAG: DUF4418 family protein [Methanospirillum sp.]|nr:DUF4418 family protein [Methanospirillum sp.]